jgi:ComF family protein
VLSIPQWLKLPRICLICEMSFKNNAPICERCEKKIKKLEALCFFCSEPTLGLEEKICISCQYQASNIHRIYVFYEYCEPIKTLITDFKFHHGYDLLNYLTDIFITNLPKDALQTQCLIPVPLHRKKQQIRGYHQTYLLAKQLGKKLSIPVNMNYCKKIKHTASQSQLTRLERSHNLDDAFVVSKPSFNKITIVDDIITTGATVQTLAKAFQALGVEHIDIWCLAKSIK